MNAEEMSASPNYGIDWAEIHQRIDRARKALDPTGLSCEQDEQAVLRARASTLAQQSSSTGAVGELVSVIEFSLASETYAVESTFVRETFPLTDFTPLPGVPPFVLGIVNVRGQILSIVDLKKFFDLPERGLGQLNKLIILHSTEMEFGVLADEILGVRSIPSEAIQPAPVIISGIGRDYIQGVTTNGVIVLDTNKLLTDEQIVVHQQER